MINLPNIMIIGLTGMSGAGKSTVCGVFARRGFTVIDCDGIARETARNKAFLSELSGRFSENLLNPDGSLDREVTAKAIFTNAEKRRLYQRIIFPYIIFEVIREIKNAHGGVLLDAPTLFESDLDIVCTRIVSVAAEKELCLKRITARDNISEEKARERLDSQHGAEFFKKRSDYFIENNGTARELCELAEGIIDKLKGEK